MDTQRLRRRQSRRRARKRQITWLIVIALVLAGWVWTRILMQRQNDEQMFTSGKVAATETPKAAPVTASKNLILFIGNGYGIAPMTAARIYTGGEDGALTIDGFPETALVRTYSRNAHASDSAAAMTAYMTGVKVDNEVLSQSAETRAYDEAGRPSSVRDESTCPVAGNGKPATTLLELAKASGRSTGVVTTARVTQAVAAASYAHLCQRGGENTIAGQLVPGGAGSNAKLGEGIDVLFGGGWQHFLPKDDPRGSSRADSRDLFAEMRAKGYAVIARQSELTATNAPIGKVLGLFHRSQMSYDLDRFGTQEPSLADMTARAIDLLQRNANGYLLIVEGGRIGEALDTGLMRKALQDARAFDEAIATALTKAKALDPELRNTTIVVTADHDQTLVINGDAALTGRTIEAKPGILGTMRSFTEPTQFANDASGRPYTMLALGIGPKRVKGPRSSAPPLNDLVLAEKNAVYESAIEGIDETRDGIGGSDVMLSAIGINASRFHGTLDNVRVFDLLRGAMGL